jgi:hypothetical protein
MGLSYGPKRLDLSLCIKYMDDYMLKTVIVENVVTIIIVFLLAE